MKRTIYTFYCHICHHWQINSYPFPCTENNYKLVSIFCNTCQQMIPLNKTNLSPYQYKIIFERQWQIIDQYSRFPHPIFFTDSDSIAKEVCQKLNSGLPLSLFQNELWTIKDILKQIPH